MGGGATRWGLEPPSFDWVKETYRSRFAIETTYRQMHQARIRTCTRSPLLRLLYVGVGLLRCHPSTFVPSKVVKPCERPAGCVMPVGKGLLSR